MLTAYRRACGNLRVWSGSDNQVTNERVRRSQQVRSVWFAVFGPGISCLKAWGELNWLSLPGLAPVATQAVYHRPRCLKTA